MSKVFDALQAKYRALVARSLENSYDAVFLEDVRTFLGDARGAGAVVSDPAERGQLRAYMRFMAMLLHEAGQEVEPLGLQPLDRERWPARTSAGRARDRMPVWFWMLAGAAMLVVVAGLVGVAGFSIAAVSLRPTPTLPPPTATRVPPTATATSTPTPTPTPAPSPTSTPRPVPPAFSDLTIALGMLGPGEPFLAGEGFDWNSKTIYAIFDYEGMRDEQEWSVVWTRDGLEVSRQDDLSWDVGRDGSSGTRWVVYHNDGFYVFGGDYTVSLYIGDELQAEASFSVGFYPTPTPEQGRLFQP